MRINAPVEPELQHSGDRTLQPQPRRPLRVPEATSRWSPNLIGQVDQSFTDLALSQQLQFSTLRQAVQRAIGLAHQQRIDDAMDLVHEAGIEHAAHQTGTAHQVDVLAGLHLQIAHRLRMP